MKNLIEKLSKSGPVLPHIPISFIPLADFEKSDVPLCTRTNVNNTIGRKDDFRINTCYVCEVCIKICGHDFLNYKKI
jgi:flavoprotein